MSDYRFCPQCATPLAWIAQEEDGGTKQRLRCPAKVVRTDSDDAITRVTLERKSGPIVLDRPDGRVVSITQPEKPERRMALPIRALSEALIEELRRLDPDELYGEVLTKGLERVETVRASAKAKA